MTTRKDILMDDVGNWMVADGDFVVGDSDEQHVGLLLKSTKGMFREFPAVGVGLVNYLKKQNNNINPLKREILLQLQLDGYKSQTVFDKNGEFTLNYEPNYTY